MKLNRQLQEEQKRAQNDNEKLEEREETFLERTRETRDADFGHTTPIFTFPIGGYSAIDTDDDIKIKIRNI